MPGKQALRIFPSHIFLIHVKFGDFFAAILDISICYWPLGGALNLLIFFESFLLFFGKFFLGLFLIQVQFRDEVILGGNTNTFISAAPQSVSGERLPIQN